MYPCRQEPTVSSRGGGIVGRDVAVRDRDRSLGLRRCLLHGVRVGLQEAGEGLRTVQWTGRMFRNGREEVRGGRVQATKNPFNLIYGPEVPPSPTVGGYRHACEICGPPKWPGRYQAYAVGEALPLTCPGTKSAHHSGSAERGRERGEGEGEGGGEASPPGQRPVTWTCWLPSPPPRWHCHPTPRRHPPSSAHLSI